MVFCFLPDFVRESGRNPHSLKHNRQRPKPHFSKDCESCREVALQRNFLVKNAAPQFIQVDPELRQQLEFGFHMGLPPPPPAPPPFLLSTYHFLPLCELPSFSYRKNR
jgi:hypothetical protein